MVQRAFISGGVNYHRALSGVGRPQATFDRIELGPLTDVDLNGYDLVDVLLSVDGDTLRPSDLDAVTPSQHPLVAHLTADQLRRS